MLRKIIAASVLSVASLSSFALTEAQNKLVAKVAADTGIPVKSIGDSPISGVAEIVAKDGNVVYMTVDGKYLVAGHIFDVASKSNLTAERAAKVSSFDWKSLPLQSALVEKKGTGARKIAVVSDINCGFCRKLEGELSQMKDVVIYRFMVGMLGPDSVKKADAVWCSKGDRNTAYHSAIERKNVPSSPACNTPTAANTKYFSEMGVSGTPTILFDDGTRIGGYSPLSKIEERLSAKR